MEFFIKLFFSPLKVRYSTPLLSADQKLLMFSNCPKNSLTHWTETKVKLIPSFRETNRKQNMHESEKGVLGRGHNTSLDLMNVFIYLWWEPFFFISSSPFLLKLIWRKKFVPSWWTPRGNSPSNKSIIQFNYNLLPTLKSNIFICKYQLVT